MSAKGKGVSLNVRRAIYTAAVRSVVDYCAPCLAGLTSTQFARLEVIQNDAMRIILGAPPWTKVITLQAELVLPSLQARVYERSAVALATYVKRYPATRLAASLRHGFQRPRLSEPDGDWIHSVVDAARALDLDFLAACEGDLGLPDFQYPPPWQDLPYTVTLNHRPAPKTHPAALLRQEALHAIYAYTSPTSRLYYTDGSADGATFVGAAFVCAGVTHGHRLPCHTTAFQAELVAILMALQHACTDGEEGLDIHVHSDSLSALQSLLIRDHSDNVALLSGIGHAIQHLYRSGHSLHFHWVPGHVGLRGNELADAAAKAASTLPGVTFQVQRSLSAIKSLARHKAREFTRANYAAALHGGSLTVPWHHIATGGSSYTDLLGLDPPTAHHISRLRLGYWARWHIFPDADNTCAFCLTASDYPLLHYLLDCPVTSMLNRSCVQRGDPPTTNAARVVAATSLLRLAAVVRQHPPPF